MVGVQFMKEEIGDPDAGVRRATLIDEGDEADPLHFVLGQVWAYLRHHVAGRAKSPDGRRRCSIEAHHQIADEQNRATDGREAAMAVSAIHECILSFHGWPYNALLAARDTVSRSHERRLLR